MATLHRQQHALSDPLSQLTALAETGIPDFSEVLEQSGMFPLDARTVKTLQVNVGKVCNQTCRHCHVDAGPDRKESMQEETFRLCLDALDRSPIREVDITGGAPEMNPHFRWFVEEVSKRNVSVKVRCNLTILLAHPRYHDLPEFFRDHKVEVISSLPYFQASRTDAQRGEGVFRRSIEALQRLNAVGYGDPSTGLQLNLVYNPSGAFLPAGQQDLEDQFRQRLGKDHGIRFNQLYCITNLPISRFLEYLQTAGKLEAYMETLCNAFNPAAAEHVMCRDLISVGWDGRLFDCDFNQMLELETNPEVPRHIRDFDHTRLSERKIITGRHCFGCTAGSGSGCGGQLT